MAPVRVAQMATADFSVRSLLSGQIKALQERGADVTAICSPGQALPDLDRMGIPVQPVPMQRRPAPLQDLRSLYGLVRTLRAGRYDAVITHTPKAGVLGPPAARMAGVPHVIHTVHGLLFHDQTPPEKVRLFRAAEQWTAWWSHHLWFQSKEDMLTVRDLKMAPPSRLRYIGNGIDLRRFDPDRVNARERKRQELGIAPEDWVVGTVARLVYEKGLGELIQAAEALVPQIPNLRVLLVGPAEPGRPDGLPQPLIDALQATGRFIFTGRRRDVEELYQAMDLFVLPSHREGIPRSLMEAGAMGLPSVATRIRGCREVVREGETGLLVPVRNADALANSILQVHRGGSGPALGQAARERVRREFDEELVHERIAAGLEEIVGRPLNR